MPTLPGCRSLTSRTTSTSGRTIFGPAELTSCGFSLLLALAYDTRCLRERLFFSLLVINFVVGCGLTLWQTIPAADVRAARIGTGVLWGLAALMSLTTLASPTEARKTSA